ncbi:MAG: alkaline phosphatase family protein, partial [Acidothermaceae bacterium]
MLHFTKRARFSVAAIAVTGAAVAGSGGVAFASGHAENHVKLDHAYVIWLENHSEHGVIGDPNAPNITALANAYGQATSYFGVTHPSEPNYVAMISGSNWWTNNDSPANRFDHTNIVDTLEAAGMSWAGYMEAMPSTGFLGDSWPSDSNALYASKHNPFVLFNDIRNNPSRLEHVKPYTDLATDLNTERAPAFVFITPDQCNDMHGGVNTAVPGHPETPCPFGSTNDDPNDAALKQKADAFVQKTVTTIMSSKAWTRHSAIFVISDEGDFTGNPTTGGWDSPAGCCESPVLPAGDPDISPSWPGGLYGGGLVPAIVINGGKAQHIVDDTPYN